MDQVVWAIDIDFGPSDVSSMSSLTKGLANVQTDRQDGRLITPGDEERYAIVSSHLKHSNLAMIQFNVFLQMCKAHLIAYNKKVNTCTCTCSSSSSSTVVWCGQPVVLCV